VAGFSWTIPFPLGRQYNLRTVRCDHRQLPRLAQPLLLLASTDDLADGAEKERVTLQMKQFTRANVIRPSHWADPTVLGCCQALLLLLWGTMPKRDGQDPIRTARETRGFGTCCRVVQRVVVVGDHAVRVVGPAVFSRDDCHLARGLHAMCKWTGLELLVRTLPMILPEPCPCLRPSDGSGFTGAFFCCPICSQCRGKCLLE
jgi:hypothetical protein